MKNERICIAEIFLLMAKVFPPQMTAGRTTERGGSSELKDELEVIEEMEDGQQVMHHWQKSSNLWTLGQNCYLTKKSSCQQQLQSKE